MTARREHVGGGLVEQVLDCFGGFVAGRRRNAVRDLVGGDAESLRNVSRHIFYGLFIVEIGKETIRFF